LPDIHESAHRAPPREMPPPLPAHRANISGQAGDTPEWLALDCPPFPLSVRFRKAQPHFRLVLLHQARHILLFHRAEKQPPRRRTELRTGSARPGKTTGELGISSGVEGN